MEQGECKELRKGYTIFYSGEMKPRNGVSMLSPAVKTKMIEIPGGRLMKMKFVTER